MKTATVSVMVKMKNSTMETIWWMVTVSVGERERERGYAAGRREADPGAFTFRH